MTPAQLDEIKAWIVVTGLSGATETTLLDGVATRCRAAGLSVTRAMVIIDTLHPVYEGRAFRWRADDAEEAAMIEYGRTNEGPEAAAWQRTVFYHMLTSGIDEWRGRLEDEQTRRFDRLEALRSDGQTDLFAHIHRFSSDGAIGEMDCVYSYWCTDHPDGFEAGHIAALRGLGAPLALAIKCASLSRIAGTLVEVYLGRDAGQRVLSGRIQRGVTEEIDAVLWFSDLRGFTAITDAASPDQIIPLLNDYADAVISAVHDAGGDVLKLIGDGVLAIFKAEDHADACRCALRAEADLRRRLVTLQARRAAEGRPITEVYLGLHIGAVFYGNVGSADRLDFTVVGPAVNEVNRIASMCRSVDRSVVLSAQFAAATPEPERTQLVSVGRYALRGVRRAQELFTLEPVA